MKFFFGSFNKIRQGIADVFRDWIVIPFGDDLGYYFTQNKDGMLVLGLCLVDMVGADFQGDIFTTVV